MSKIWAIADLHLSFGVPNKSMDIFGPRWHDHAERLGKYWRKFVGADDLVLLAGDISWAKHLEEALIDLKWIHTLPGTKVMIRGNHDYWWASKKKLSNVLPPSLHVIHNDTFNWKGVSIGGSRLWDTSEYHFNEFIEFVKGPVISKRVKEGDVDANKIFQRELHRLEMSLKGLQQDAQLRIAMTHYPPIGPSLGASEASRLLEQYNVDICVFGHLHSVPPGTLPFGERKDVRYVLTSCDYIECQPLKIYEL